MTMLWKPLLSATVPIDPATGDFDWSTVVFPCYASPKYDGFRCTVQRATLVSRNGLPVRNKELQKRYGAQGLQVVGVSMDDGDQKDVEKFAAENSINYPVLFGKDSVADQYGGISYLPTTFYIDRNGVVLNRVFGQAGRDEIEQDVKRAIDSKAHS